MAAPALADVPLPATNGHANGEVNRSTPVLELDALMLREHGHNVKLVELRSDYGGVWYWNLYPGARVDSTIPHYEFSDAQLSDNWHWKQRFPGSEELRSYFQHVAEKWKLRKDTIFNTFVNSAVWNAAVQRWSIRTSNGKHFKAKFFLANTGFAAKRHTSDWKGLDTFKGTWFHPSYWPKNEPNVKGKRVAVIGTGATGIQVCQGLAPLASEFTLFQRTPNQALPMGQIEYKETEQRFERDKYAAFFSNRNTSFGGFDFNFHPKELWKKGDFHFRLATYYDMLFSDDANTEAYNFWRDKTRARIDDARIKEKLAPMTEPHPIGCKRVSVENGFYELFNAPKAHLVDVNETPIEEVTGHGIRTTENHHEFHRVVCATGFDAVIGGLNQMNIRGENGVSLTEKWAQDGVATYLGMSVSGFPNMFFTYGPQAPTAFCNGPTCAKLQGNWIIGLMDHMREERKGRVDASAESQREWAGNIWKMAGATLLPTAKALSCGLRFWSLLMLLTGGSGI